MAKKRVRDEPVDTWMMCPRCGRREFRYRTRTDDYRCRICGLVFQADFIRQRTGTARRGR